MVERQGQVLNLAAAYRREERYFVAGLQQGVPGGKLLIARGHDGGTVFGQLRDSLRIECKELLDCGCLVEVKRILGLADNVFQAAEEKDLDANSLGDRRHKGIVARAAESSHSDTRLVTGEKHLSRRLSFRLVRRRKVWRFQHERIF